MTSPVDNFIGALERGGFDPRPSGDDRWESRCPSHDGGRRNLSIKRGDDGRVLLHCHHGGTCDHKAIVESLGMKESDLFAGAVGNGSGRAHTNGKPAGKAYPSMEAAAAAVAKAMSSGKAKWSVNDDWTYRHADGTPLFSIVRLDSDAGEKTFRPVRRTPDGWRLGDPAGPLPLHRLPELAQASRIFVTEGERCAYQVTTLDLAATTSAHGARSAHKSDWSPLKAKEVIILPDRDEPGEKYAASVVGILAKLTPRPTVRIVRLPGIPAGGDVIDWLAANPQMTPAQARAELERMADAAPLVDLDPEPAPEPDDAEPWPPMRIAAPPPVETFPVDVLPASVEGFVHAVSGSIGCPPDFAGLPVLIVAGAAIGRSASMRLKPDFFASASLYGMNVGGPSSGKSPALDAVVRPMWRIDEALHDDYKAERVAHDDAVARLDKIPKADRPPPPARPTIRTAMLDDSTVETIADHLALNPRGLLVSKDEGSALVASFNQYKGGKGTDRQFWLSALFGKPIRVDRKKNVDLVPTRIPHPFLSVVGNLTPEMIGDLREPSGRSDGFIERILFACPDPRPRPRWTDEGIPDDVAATWAGIVHRLRARPMACTDGKDHPHAVAVADDAKAAWRDFYDAHAAETNSPDYDTGELAAEGKLVDFAARMALILHMLDLASDPMRGEAGEIPPVTRRAVEGAIRLWHYFRSHHKRARALMQGRGAGATPRGAQLVLNWIRNHPDKRRFSFSDITKVYPPSRGHDAAMLHDGIEWLERRHAIRTADVADRPKGTAGRKPPTTWEVRPDLATMQENQGNQESNVDAPEETPDCPVGPDSPAPPGESGEEVGQWEG